MIPLVTASEKGTGQTEYLLEKEGRCGEHYYLSMRFKLLWKEGP